MGKEFYKNKTSGQISMDFDIPLESLYNWPNQLDFPINYLDRNVESIILPDIERSKNFTVLTGYTSLSYLIDCFGQSDRYTKDKKIKIVLGFDPNFRGRKRYRTKSLDIEIAEYWLQKRLSILQGGSIINLISKIKSGNIEIKFYNKLHSKIYVGDETAMIGSANFSSNGLKKQTESNYRTLRSDDEFRYSGIKDLADNYFHLAEPYPQIIDLLENLISQVDWKDALARAISEVLEGGWLSEYKNLMSRLDNANLWPTQWSGLAQAMNILQENSNVLIADPTGAGKTKLCSTIILALESWLYENGRKEKANSIIVCPPLVKEKWQGEFRELATISNNQISNGTLSNGKAKSLKKAEKELELANILAIDEAHNYLNVSSKRSIAIRKNKADFKLLITATPINKKVDDLLKIIELLDVDNLDDESFEVFKNLRLRPDLSKPEDILKLKGFVSRFTVRRTKSSINDFIDLEPEKYKNALGNICRFPNQVPKVYDTEETENDIEIVNQISEICKKLKGITYLKKITKPKFEISEDKRQSYVNNRLNVAKHLSIYVIRHRLRSSNIALLEHIIGAKDVQKFKSFKTRKLSSNKIKTNQINDLIIKGTVPFISPYFKNCELPSWITNQEEYVAACEEELLNYKKIANLVKKLSGKRELGKANELLRQIKTHRKTLAFDTCIITLYYLKHILEQKSENVKVLIASGDNVKESEEVLDKFNLKSENNERIIALCSDKMSEGVDLQKASAVTLLDLPSVIRIVEQRFGRIDRMDTPIPEIEMYWPNDSEAFSLRGDKRLYALSDLVTDTIGSNFEIPSELKFRKFSTDNDIKGIINEYQQYEKLDESWEGIQDSFQPILDLKQGKKALITEEEYNAYKNVKSQVKVGVSFLKSEQPWCFIATRGDKKHSPKWYFIHLEPKETVLTDFGAVSSALRNELSGKEEKLEWNNHHLEYYLKILRKKEIELLPPKKRRALEVAKEILQRRLKSRFIDRYEKEIIGQLLKLFSETNKAVDFDEFASSWIDFLQPYLDDKRERNFRNRQSFNLNELKKKTEIKRINFDLEKLQSIIEDTPLHQDIDSKIVSCIVGVPI